MGAVEGALSGLAMALMGLLNQRRKRQAPDGIVTAPATLGSGQIFKTASFLPTACGAWFGKGSLLYKIYPQDLPIRTFLIRPFSVIVARIRFAVAADTPSIFRTSALVIVPFFSRKYLI